VWRIIFGFSVLYFLLLVFMAFLNINQVRKIMVWLDPNIKDAKREVDLVEVCSNTMNEYLFTFSKNDVIPSAQKHFCA